jgi:hypothetical protein
MRKWYSAPELLTMATATNAQLVKLAGPRDPYPGRLGVVQEGALKDGKIFKKPLTVSNVWHPREP